MIDIDTMSNTTMPMWRPGDWRPGPVFSTATETLLLSLGVTTFYRKGPLIYYVILSYILHGLHNTNNTSTTKIGRIT